MAFKKAGRSEGTPRKFRDERGPHKARSFDKGPRTFEKKSFGRDRAGPELHDVNCAKCGVATQVPFRPTGAKPVYCRDCFSQGDDSRPRRTAASSGGSSADLQAIHEKLDKIMRALDIE